MPAARRWVWLLFILAIVAADRATKYAIERDTPEDFRRVLIPRFADLVHSENRGIAFGLFSQLPSRAISSLLIVSASVVVIVLLWLLFSGRTGGFASQAGIALVAAGAAGNSLDRVLHGSVTDFLELHAGRFVWPAFNVADSAIAVGACLVAWELLRDAQPTSTRASL